MLCYSVHYYQKLRYNQRKRTDNSINPNFLNGALEATRTPDPQLRRLLLYPTELQAHVSDNYIK